MDNLDDGFAAVVKYPCLAVLTGYLDSGKAISLTLKTIPFEEQKMVEIGYKFELINKCKKASN